MFLRKIVSPVGLKQFKLFIVFKAIILILFTLPVYAASNNTGQIVFFAVGTFEDWQSKDALDDFLYYYERLTPWLDEMGFCYSLERQLPITISAKDQVKIFQRSNLAVDLGLILVAGDGKEKIIYGVLTDVDWQSEIKAFLKIP